MSVFLPFTPLFGIAAGIIVLGETMSAKFAVAVILVLAGVTVVN